MTDTIPCPTGVVLGSETSTVVARLFQNYPNPFNPVTTITFELMVAQKVELNIYAVDGRIIKTLLAERLEPGRHAKTWHGLDEMGRPVSSGIYLLSLAAEDFVATKRMLLIR